MFKLSSSSRTGALVASAAVALLLLTGCAGATQDSAAGNPAGQTPSPAASSDSSYATQSLATFAKTGASSTQLSNPNLIPVANPQNIAISPAAPNVGIVTNGSPTLTVVNVATNTVTGQITIPNSSFVAGTIEAQPASPFVYVGNNQGNQVAVINAVTQTFVTQLQLPEGTSAGAYVTNGFITFGGQYAYVLNSYWADDPTGPPTAITLINLDTQQVVRQIVMPTGVLSVPGPANGVLTPSGKGMYVAAYTPQGDGVFQITFALGSKKSGAAANYPWSRIATLPNVGAIAAGGGKLFAAQNSEDYVTAINTTTNKIVGTIQFQPQAPSSQNIAWSLAVTPDGKYLFEGGFYNDAISKVDLATRAMVQIPVNDLSGNFEAVAGNPNLYVPQSDGILVTPQA